MAHSREVRLPFLDRRIAEFLLSLPPGLLYRPGQPKWILRAAARGAAPDAILDRRDKIGFETPQERWFGEDGFRARIAEVLLDPAARARGLYDTAAIERDLAGGGWRNTDALWRALNAELWIRELIERR
jgi:asparagine synthase (glutamine-hydrolysing)